jgi:thioredoxin reductase
VQSTKHLSQLYPNIAQIPKEKILRIEGQSPDFTVTTNKNTYKSKIIVVAIGAANTFQLMG